MINIESSTPKLDFNIPNQINETTSQTEQNSPGIARNIAEFSKEYPNIKETGATSFSGLRLNVHITTWNIHGKLPTPEHLEILFGSRFDLETHDIFAIGTQECQKSIGASLILPSKKKWEALVQTYFSETHTLVKTVTLAAIHLIVLVKNEIMPFISGIESGSVATGFLNILGNKGAVAVGFNLQGKSFLFINSHLRAHQDRISDRTKDYHRINYTMKLRKSSSSAAYVCNRYDYVFWCGDLNYRINGIRKAIDAVMEKGMEEVLMANDQLKREMKHHHVFYGFYEAPITFPPTYKYDPDTDSYDTSKKGRIPSWTDRILIKTMGKFMVNDYKSLQLVRLSDHKPVVAIVSLLP